MLAISVVAVAAVTLMAVMIPLMIMQTVTMVVFDVFQSLVKTPMPHMSI
jgi:hypothetical protein